MEQNQKLTEPHTDAPRDESDRLRARVTELEARIVDLERLADSDTLTPLPNRRHFLRMLDAALHRLRRHSVPAVVLFVDVDGLKTINDTLGHNAGDAALIHVAQALAAHVRATDIVARIGGDEFGILLDHLDVCAARTKAIELQDAIEAAPLDCETATVLITLSIGIAALHPADTLETALERADTAMYAARRGQGPR